MSGRAIWIWLLVLLVVVLLNLPLPVALQVKGATRENLSPFENGLSLLVRRVHDATRLFTAAGGAADQRLALEQRIADLQLRLWEADAIERENESLRQQLSFGARHRYRLVPCEVIARGDAGGWWQVLTLNRGRSSGIRPNQAVITPDGLVGRTTNTQETTCEVTLVTDPASRVACKIRGTEAFGILRGGGLSLAGKPSLGMLAAAEPGRMDYIPKGATLEREAEVVTSGLGGIYPEGLPVGRVQGVIAVPSGLYQSADIQPAADLRALRYVFVVVGQGEREAPAGGEQEAESEPVG